MTTNEYLQLQATLLNSLENLKTLPLREIATKLDRIDEEGMVDHIGSPVRVYTAHIRKVLSCAEKFIAGVNAEAPKYYRTECYRMECICGRKIESPTPEARCECGIEIRVEWQAEIKPKRIRREGEAA